MVGAQQFGHLLGVVAFLLHIYQQGVDTLALVARHQQLA